MTENKQQTETLICPVGESHCVLLDEVQALRAEVRSLSKQLRTDPLTGLYNYRHFVMALDQEMERARRSRQPAALVMLDLDHFKRVNDRWGHEVGNRALVAAAEAVANTVRQLDICCRYGGEEFAIILPSVDLSDAIRVAQRVREGIEVAEVLVDGEDIGLTASLGLAVIPCDCSDSGEQLVARADGYLYQAKQQGRNRVAHEILPSFKSEAGVSLDERAALFGLYPDQESSGQDAADEEPDG